MTNPFQPYLTQRYCPDLETTVDDSHSCERDYLTLPRIYSPEVRIHKSTEKIIARIGTSGYELFSLKDLIGFEGVLTQRTPRHFQGVFGERLLSLLMDSFISQLVAETEDVGGVIREKGHFARRGYVAAYNNDFLLKVDTPCTFVLLTKTEEHHMAAYRQEKFGLQSTEIDGLAYLHSNSTKYLVIGEVSTRNSKELHLNSWETEENLEDKLFGPIRSLFPEHELVYLLAAPRKALLHKGKKRLKKRARVVVETLEQIGVQPILIPLPNTEPTLTELSRETASQLTIVRAVLENL